MSRTANMRTPSQMPANELEALTGEFGGEDGAQSFGKFFSIHVMEGESLTKKAQQELSILAKRLAALGIHQDFSFEVEFGKLVEYGQWADVWCFLTVLPSRENPEPPKVPGA